jgi:exodeoxyribonuclease VII small subunit
MAEKRNSSKKENSEPVKPSFEEILVRLEKIVEELEAGELSLDESMARYEEGAAALKTCRALLEQAEKKIEMLVKDEDGALKPQPFEPPANSSHI